MQRIKSNKKIYIIVTTIVLVSALLVLYFIPEENLKILNNDKNNSLNDDVIVKFDSNGGSEVSEILIKKGRKLVNIPESTKEEYEFVSWQINGKDFDFNNQINNNITLKATWKEIFPSNREVSNDEFNKMLDNLLLKKDYDEYAIRLIKSMISDYQKILSNKRIYMLFYDLDKITINPYDPANPNLSQDDRGFYANNEIVINCFENELVNDQNWDGLRWLLTHELIHSIGDLKYSPSKFSSNQISARNHLLEEGLADSIANFVKKVPNNMKYAVAKQSDFKMYKVNDDLTVDTTRYDNHTYILSGNVINMLEYIGCRKEVINTLFNDKDDELKSCFYTNVKNGKKYFGKLNDLLDLIYLHTIYPNEFITTEEVLNNNKNNNLITEELKSINLNDLLIEYAKLSAEIINNKNNNDYSICDYKKINAVLFSDDGINFKSDLNCND